MKYKDFMSNPTSDSSLGVLNFTHNSLQTAARDYRAVYKCSISQKDSCAESCKIKHSYTNPVD